MWRPANPDLNGKERTFSVGAYQGTNPLLKHGFVRAIPGQRYFAHADGTPFLWLADTWWKGLCQRLTWDGFRELTADRRAKGFSVIQIVCGPYPDENFFQPSWARRRGPALPGEGSECGQSEVLRVCGPETETPRGRGTGTGDRRSLGTGRLQQPGGFGAATSSGTGVI